MSSHSDDAEHTRYPVLLVADADLRMVMWAVRTLTNRIEAQGGDPSAVRQLELINRNLEHHADQLADFHRAHPPDREPGDDPS